MNIQFLNISPRMRSAQQHQLPAAVRPWRGVRVLANVMKSRSLCTVYKVTTVIT